MTTRKPPISISPWKVTSRLLLVVSLLVIAGVAVTIATYQFDRPTLWGLGPQLKLDAERNIPTFVSAFMLLAAGGLSALIAAGTRRLGGRHALVWVALALLLTFLSIDETVGVHEEWVEMLQLLVVGTGRLWYAWVIPVLVVLAAIGVGWSFLIKLPRTTRNLLVLALAVYLSGALGVELLAGYRSWTMAHDATFHMLTVVEELCEMLGVVILIHALVWHLGHLQTAVLFSDDPGRA